MSSAISTQDNSAIKSFFDDNGYYLARGVFSEAELEGLTNDFDRIVNQLENSGENVNARWEGAQTDELDGGASRIVHTHNVQRYSARWFAALHSPTLLDTVETLIGPDIVLHHTKLFLKPPENGAPFPMHQDWTYFPTRDDTMIAGIVFLSDADSESGGLCVYPGSHKLGRIADSSGRVESEVLAQYPLEGATTIDAKRGDVFFFSYLTLHGSTPNRSKQDRKTVLVQLLSGSDYVLGTTDHVDEGLVLRGWNQHMTRERAAR